MLLPLIVSSHVQSRCYTINFFIVSSGCSVLHRIIVTNVQNVHHSTACMLSVIPLNATNAYHHSLLLTPMVYSFMVSSTWPLAPVLPLCLLSWLHARPQKISNRLKTGDPVGQATCQHLPFIVLSVTWGPLRLLSNNLH